MHSKQITGSRRCRTRNSRKFERVSTSSKGLAGGSDLPTETRARNYSPRSAHYIFVGTMESPPSKRKRPPSPGEGSSDGEGAGESKVARPAPPQDSASGGEGSVVVGGSPSSTVSASRTPPSSGEDRPSSDADEPPPSAGPRTPQGAGTGPEDPPRPGEALEEDPAEGAAPPLARPAAAVEPSRVGRFQPRREEMHAEKNDRGRRAVTSWYLRLNEFDEFYRTHGHGA